MGKRVVISLIAIMSLGAVWWTDADAATTCLQYRTIGGSSMCTAWSTKGVLVDVTFNQDCGPDRLKTLCTATATAETTHSIAFSAQTLHVPQRFQPRPVVCNETGAWNLSVRLANHVIPSTRRTLIVSKPALRA